MGEFYRLRKEIDLALEYMLSGPDEKQRGKPEAILPLLLNEAGKLNGSLQRELVHLGETGLSWKGTESFKQIWSEVQDRLAAKLQSESTGKKELLENLAAWLERQNIICRGAKRDKYREKIEAAANELRQAATTDLRRPFPGQENRTPKLWWDWQVREDDGGLERTVTQLREVWKLTNFADILEDNQVMPEETDFPEEPHRSVIPKAELGPAPMVATVSESTPVESIPSLDLVVEVPSQPFIPMQCTIPIADANRLQADMASVDSPAEEVEDPPTEDKIREDGALAHSESLAKEMAFAWDMLKCDRADLAYYWALEKENSGEPSFPSSNIVRSLILANHLDEDNNDFVREYEQAVKSFQDDLDKHLSENSQKEITHLLSLSASLIPLISRNSNAAQALVNKVAEYVNNPDLKELARTVRDYAKTGLGIEPLRRDFSTMAAEGKTKEQFQASAKDWLREARVKKIIFDPATKVWHHWLSEKGELGPLLQAIIDDKIPEIDRLVKVADKWRQTKYVEREMQAVDYMFRKNSAKRNPIDARSKTSLREHVRKCLQFFDEWRLISNQMPGNTNLEKIGKYRKELQKCFPKVEEYLGKLDNDKSHSATENGRILAAGRHLLRNTVICLREILTNPEKRGVARRPVGFEPNLLRIPKIKLKIDAGGVGWLAESPKLFSEALEFAAKDNRNWLELAEMHRKNKDFSNADCSFELAELAGTPDEKARGKLNEELRKTQSDMKLQFREDRKTVDRAYSEGIISDSERANFDWPDKSSDIYDFSAWQDKSNEMRILVDQKTIEVRRSIQEQMANNSDLTEEKRKLINDLLEKGRFRSIEGVMVGESYIENNAWDEDNRFFPEYLQHIDKLIQAKPSLDGSFFQEAAKKGQLNWRLATYDIERSLHLLRQYSELYRSGLRQGDRIGGEKNLGKQQTLVKEILTDIGFANVKFNAPPLLRTGGDEGSREIWFEVECRPIEERSVCPIPAFGSEAGGRYNIHCVWDRPHGQALCDMAKNDNRPGKTIVFYMDWMDINRHRDLAQQCRNLTQDKAFLVLDYYLLLYVAGQPNRLAAFFKNAMMFTSCQPYGASNNFGIPREMFYGRKKVLENICRGKAHLVYGGRQLGKTVLLHAARQEMHRPEQESFAFYLDLKSDPRTHLGTTNPPEHIWSVMSQVLAEQENPVEPRTRIIAQNVTAADTFSKRIRDWLMEKENRQISFFLDEADAFLEADRKKDWTIVGEMKSLMNNTKSRFNIVLAGLHNVQRTAKESNTSLAHFDDPICVGAFTDDPLAAHDMINTPLQALGYRFEDKDLYFEILQMTNYYPSLIQIFCRNLLETLGKQQFHNQRDVPPYVIKQSHIQDAYRISIDHIRERFSWSLDLDPRYRFLAYMIAEELRKNPNGTYSISVHSIRSLACEKWAMGFGTQTGTSDFAVLLEEMEGLGILRRDSGGAYTLRNRNVMGLLGGQKDFEAGMDEARNMATDVQYSPDIFRKKCKSGRRSPLTESQERQLQEGGFGVVVIFGSAAAELGMVPSALESSSMYNIEKLDASGTIENFKDRLGTFMRAAGRGRDKKDHYFIVTPEAGWDDRWLKHAISQCKIGRNTTRKMKAVFLGNHTMAWNWFVDGIKVSDEKNLGIIGLLPWHEETLKQWLDSLEIPLSDVERMHKSMWRSGGWGGLCERYSSQVNRSGTKWDKILDDVGKWSGSNFFFENFGLKTGSQEHTIFKMAVEAFDVDSSTIDKRGYCLSPIVLSDLAIFLDDPSTPGLAEKLPRVWKWAEAMNYIKRDDSSDTSDAWLINTALCRFAQEDGK